MFRLSFRYLSCCLLYGIVAISIANAQGLMIGGTAPDFELPGVDDETYTLESFEDADVLVVVFTCNHCPTSRLYEDRIKQLVLDFADQNVALVAISPNDNAGLRLDEMGMTDVDDSFESMKIRAEDAAFNFPYLYAGDQQDIVRAYGATATPDCFVFDSQRELRYRGRFDDSAEPERIFSHDLRNAVEAILGGNPVPLDWTRPFGCSVKWSDKSSTVEEAANRYAEEPVRLDAISTDVVPTLLDNRSRTYRMIHFWSSENENAADQLDELIDAERMYRRHPILFITINMDGADEQESLLELLTEHQASCINLILDDETSDEAEDESESTEAAAVEEESEGENDTAEETAEEETPLPFPACVDEEWDGEQPLTILIAPDGEIVWRSLGDFERLELRRAVLHEFDLY